jgi:hypothetical protein
MQKCHDSRYLVVAWMSGLFGQEGFRTLNAKAYAAGSRKGRV